MTQQEAELIHQADELRLANPAYALLLQMEKDEKSGEEMYQLFKQALETGVIKDNLKGLIPNSME